MSYSSVCTPLDVPLQADVHRQQLSHALSRLGRANDDLAIIYPRCRSVRFGGFVLLAALDAS